MFYRHGFGAFMGVNSRSSNIAPVAIQADNVLDSVADEMKSFMALGFTVNLVLGDHEACGP